MWSRERYLRRSFDSGDTKAKEKDGIGPEVPEAPEYGQLCLRSNSRRNLVTIQKNKLLPGKTPGEFGEGIMGKTLAVAFGGIFIGALAMEILNRTTPKLTKGIEEKARKVADTFAKGFNEGWRGTATEAESPQPEQSAT